jgi:hypothetical protein
VIAPLTTSLMLGWGWGVTQVFFATAIAPFIAALFVLAFALHADWANAASAAPSAKIS